MMIFSCCRMESACLAVTIGVKNTNTESLKNLSWVDFYNGVKERISKVGGNICQHRIPSISNILVYVSIVFLAFANILVYISTVFVPSANILVYISTIFFPFANILVYVSTVFLSFANCLVYISTILFPFFNILVFVSTALLLFSNILVYVSTVLFPFPTSQFMFLHKIIFICLLGPRIAVFNPFEFLVYVRAVFIFNILLYVSTVFLSFVNILV